MQTFKHLAGYNRRSVATLLATSVNVMKYNTTAISNIYLLSYSVQFLVKLSEISKFNYRCIAEVMVNDGVVLDCIILKGVCNLHTI